MSLKKIVIFCFVLIVSFSNKIFSHPEIWMSLFNSSGSYLVTEVRVYEKIDGNYVLSSSGRWSKSYAFFTPDYNAFGDVGDNSSTNQDYTATWNKMEFGTNNLKKKYLIYLVSENKYCHILIGKNLSSGSPDVFIEYRNGVFQERSPFEGVITLGSQGNWNEKTVTVKNSFNAGKVYVDNILENSGVTKNFGEPTFPHILKAKLNQWDAGYIQDFNNWYKNYSNVSSNIEHSIEAISATYKADFSRQFNITFRNQFPNGSNSGVIKVDNQQINSPSGTIHNKQGIYIKGEAVEQTISGYHYMFDHWNQEGGSASPYNFSPPDHRNYTAVYRYCHARHLSFNGGASAGTPIKLYWHKHEVPNITSYQIWRKVGKSGSPEVIANVSSSTSSFTDYSYVHSSGTGSDKLLHYDVRYYANGSYASPDFRAIYGEEVEYLPKQNNKNVVDDTNYNEIVEYSLSSFPNPFNPSTHIYFKVKEAGHVLIKVYDMLGKEIVTLLNEEKPRGDFVVQFDGSNLSSGIYILTMQVNDFYKSQKLLLTK